MRSNQLSYPAIGFFKKDRQEWKPLNSLKIFLCSGTRD